MNNTHCVIEEQQSLDGVAIMSYEDYKSSNCQRTILFTGTFESCDVYRSQYTVDNPFYINEEIESANREHAPTFTWDNTRTASENHFDFSEFCKGENLSLEDTILYIYEEKGVATSIYLTVNALEQELYSLSLEECEFKS